MSNRRRVKAIALAVIAIFSSYFLFPAVELLMRVVPMLRGHPAEAIAIVVAMFVTSVAMVAARLDPRRPPDDTVMLPVLFATGASFLTALLVAIRIWERDQERGLSTPTDTTVLVFAVIMIPSVVLAFWWGARRYGRLQS